MSSLSVRRISVKTLQKPAQQRADQRRSRAFLCKFAAPSCTFQGRSRAYTRARGGAYAREISSVFCIGFLRWVLYVGFLGERFFQSRVKDSFSLREKFFQSQGKVFSVQSEKFFQSEPRKKRADGLNRLLVIGNAAERSGELVIKVQQRKGGHIIPPSRANTSAARL